MLFVTRKTSLLFFLTIFLMLANASADTVSPSYAFDVSIFPDKQSPGVFQAKFTVTDLNSNTVVSAPKIRFRAGQPAEASAATQTKAVSFEFSVSVDEIASVAEFKAQAIKDGTPISRSQGTISLNISAAH